MSVTFKATASADIAANHLITKSVSDGAVSLASTAAGAVPDYFATNAIKKDDEVSVTVSALPAWNVTAGAAIKLGDSIVAGEGGTAVPGTDGVFGYAANAAAEGELVTVILIDRTGMGAIPAATTSAIGGVKEAALTSLVAADDAVAAAGDTPTKAEYDAVVALVNELKSRVNSLINNSRAAGQAASS